MKKSKLILSFIAVLSIVFIIVGCSGSVSAAEAYVTVDINPSIELVINNKEKVVYVNALNEDAEVLLVDLELVGLNVDDAMDLIIEHAIELGYIDTDAEETLVSVSTTSDTDLGAQIKERVMAAINNAFMTRAMMGKAQDKVFSEEFIAEAESLGVEPAFLFLAYNVTYVDDSITLDDALAMTQEELVTILQDARSEAKDIAQTYKQEFLAAREEIRNTYQPQIAALEEQITALEEQIAAATDDTTELEAQLATLEADLQTLKDELGAEMNALRTEYQAKTADLVSEYQALMEQRQSMYSEKVQQWIQNRENRMSQWQQAIENYQNGTTDSTD